jgi:photosystem II stability/assembly factor-like uncharacterized protein
VENEGLTIRGLAIQPGNSDVVYAAGEISSFAWAGREIMGRNFDKVQGVIYKSTDAGETWEAVWRGDNLARYILIDPNDVNVLYISTGIFDREAADSDVVADFPGGEGILKSTDGGENWTQINEGLENLYINSLSMHPSDSTVLLAGAGNNVYHQGSGVYLSTNGGETWQRMTHEVISAVDFAPSDPDIAYAAGETSFYRSADGEYQQWVLQEDPDSEKGWGPRGFAPGIPIDIQVDPRDPLRVFVNNYAGGNLLSADGGRTWMNASNGYSGAGITGLAMDPSNPAILYTNGKNGTFRTLNGGGEWLGMLPAVLRDGMINGAVATHPTAPGTLWISTGEGKLMISRDGGDTWEMQMDVANELWSLHSEQPQYFFQGIYAIEFAPSDPQRGYAGFGFFNCNNHISVQTCSSEAYQSFLVTEDGGESWQEVLSNISGHTVRDIVVHPENHEIVWVVSPGRGILFSGDAGANWENITGTIGTLQIADLAIDPTDPQRMYVATIGRGVYASEDGGATWRLRSSGMDPNEQVSSIVVDPAAPDVLYAGSLRSGLYLSEDAGATWQLHNDGLTFRSIEVLELSSDGQTLYAGTTGGGVYRLSALSQEDLDALAPQASPEPTATLAASATPEEPAAAETVNPTPEGDAPSGGLCAGAVALPLVLVMFTRRKENAT